MPNIRETQGKISEGNGRFSDSEKVRKSETKTAIARNAANQGPQNERKVMMMFAGCGCLEGYPYASRLGELGLLAEFPPKKAVPVNLVTAFFRPDTVQRYKFFAFQG